MRAPAVSFANKLWAAALAALLTFTLVPASAFAKGESDSADASGEGLQEVGSEQVDEGSGSTPAASPADGGTLASALVGAPTTFINSDVALDGEPVIGSFTVDGLTFAVTEGSDVELVGVLPDWKRVTDSQEGDGSPVAPMLASGPDGLALALPESVAYEGVDYAVASIGAYAFYLSGVASVELPASVGDVDDRTFRSSDVAAVEVADGNPTYSSFDGALYDAGYSSLLLIPEGKQGTVLLPSTAESAAPSVFSHCPLMTQISVEEGSAAFASENGLLYTSDLTTLLRAPAGATDIVIHDGCTTIAAGALEACASLATITAPASVTSISPDVFTSVPTVSLPAVSAVADDPGASTGATEGPSEQAGSAPASSPASTQLTAMVALSFTDDDLPKVMPVDITINIPEELDDAVWKGLGFQVVQGQHAQIQDIASYAADSVSFYQVGAPSQIQLMLVRNGTETPRYASTPLSLGPSSRGRRWGNYVQLQYSGSHDDVHPMPPTGYHVEGVYHNAACTQTVPEGTMVALSAVYFKIAINAYTVVFDSQEGPTVPSITATYNEDITLPSLSRTSYLFLGWDTSPEGDGFRYQPGEIVRNLSDSHQATVRLYAQWERVEYDLGFDVDSEPGDEDYPGIEKPDEIVNVESGPTVIEDPKRPGYVFQGWVIPDADGEHAIDQDLVYQDESDGKWYVDASKLPDYANDEGRVELTARWTSVISVDVPSAATFYYDLVTDQSGEAHEAALSGTTSFSSQSQVDLRVCGLESVKAEGADSLFASGADGAVMSVYPATGGSAVTVEGAQGAAGAKPASAVDFALDDVVLEGAFAKAGSDAFAIPAGDDLTLTYRLNLGTGATLDYDRILAMAEGDEASLASITYTFAADYNSPSDWGEPLWIENPDTSAGAPRFLLLDDIKAAAEDLSAHASDPTRSAYYPTYRSLLDQGASFYLNVGGAYHDVQVLGICQDAKTSGGKAGLTFGFKEPYAFRPMNAEADNTGGWTSSAMRSYLNGEFLGALATPMRNPATGIVPVDKAQQGGSEAATQVQVTRGDKVFIPSSYELYGLDWDTESSANSFQYQWFAKTETYMTGVGTICANDGTIKYKNGTTQFWWGRSGAIYDVTRFFHIGRDGTRCFNKGSMALGVVPCFAL